MDASTCPLCEQDHNPLLTRVQDFGYFHCRCCGCIFLDYRVIEQIDQGQFVRKYDSSYWKEELKAARERSFGPSLARVSEVLLYARRPVAKFLDIGAGAGFLLDALCTYLPFSRERFFGVELFPPLIHTTNPNFIVGGVKDVQFSCQAGSCIEVIEHLTPKMFCSLGAELAKKSDPEAIYIFNTGLADFVKNNNINYLDPCIRGHIMSYSLQAVKLILKPYGFTVLPIPRKDWAFIAEYQSESKPGENIVNRIWTALPENVNILKDPIMGSLMYVLGLDTSRAYL